MMQILSEDRLRSVGGVINSRASRLDVEDTHGGWALGPFLTGALHLPLEEACDLVDFGSVQVNGRQERDPRRELRKGDRVNVHWPWRGVRRHYELDPLRVIYRDKMLLAYDKESGVPSQQTPSDGYNNLFAAVRRYLQREKRSSNPYAALHHRLDQETSGIMIFALDRSVNGPLGKIFENRKVQKDYLAWVSGEPQSSGWTCREDISRLGGRYCTVPRGKGRSAETFFQVLHAAEGRTLVLARPLTGRTHQIRLHLAACGLPILGDRLYGGHEHPKLLLHAWQLSLPHPGIRKELRLAAPIPEDWPPPHSIATPAAPHT